MTLLVDKISLGSNLYFGLNAPRPITNDKQRRAWVFPGWETIEDSNTVWLAIRPNSGRNFSPSCAFKKTVIKVHSTLNSKEKERKYYKDVEKWTFCHLQTVVVQCPSPTLSLSFSSFNLSCFKAENKPWIFGQLCILQ